MKIETFEMERLQSLYENVVDCNLTESGVHPFTLAELLDEQQIKELLDVRLGYGQTDGAVELRGAISRLYQGANRANVLVTNGSAEANLISTWSMLEPGDELVLMLPNYMQIWGLARSFGITVKPFYLKEELDWAPDMEEVKRLVSSKTKMIALCNPNNPTGAVLSRRDMKAIVDLARKVDAWIYSDEVYRGAELDGKETGSFYGLYDKTAVTGGLSKAYGLPGLRLGWLVGPEEFIAKAWSYRDYTTISTGILSQKIAGLVLQPGLREKVLERSRRMLRENVRLLQDWVKRHDGLFSFIPPRAGAIAFLHYYFDVNSRQLATRLREEKGVFVVDGDCFGMDRYLRIGIGSKKEYLRTGLQLIHESLQEIRAK